MGNEINIALVGVALPALIVLVGFVYVRTITERIDNTSDQVDQLWNRVNEISSQPD